MGTVHRNREPNQGEARSQLFLTLVDRGLCCNDGPRVLTQYLAELRLFLIQTTISPRYIKGIGTLFLHLLAEATCRTVSRKARLL